jgi:predicted nucleic acid-binding protein
MIILDSSVWIEFLRNNRNYYPAVSSLLEQREVLALAPIFGELLQGTKSQRERTIIQGYYEHLPKFEFNRAFIEASIYSSEQKLTDKGVGLIDSLIIVSAIRSSAQIWTLDKKLYAIIPRELRYVMLP